MFSFLQVVQGIVVIIVVSGALALYRSLKAPRTPPRPEEIPGSGNLSPRGDRAQIAQGQP